jgi:DNA (cytosine-5)-methyltransferase 1
VETPGFFVGNKFKHLTCMEHPENMYSMNRTYYEFFAGGGMARLGLGSGWSCLMANDISEKKAETYCQNFGGDEFRLKSVYDLTSSDMPGAPSLAWASFPCQDLSLAGNRNGLAGERSGTFWGFWTAIHKLKIEGRAPPVLVLENVTGTLTSNEGRDFVEICRALSSFNYCFGAVVVDAVHFLPQSRPRLFIVCVDESQMIPGSAMTNKPMAPWHTSAVRSAVNALPAYLAAKWRWWKLPKPHAEKAGLAGIIENHGKLSWHSKEETQRLLAMMSAANRDKIREAQNANARVVGTIYKRTRIEDGERVQRAEVRFDGIAGCLRTPGGGSSRQTVIIVDGSSVRTRLLTVREAARLMGVPETYAIPTNYNDGYHVFGDGLAVPAVTFIRENLIEPIYADLAARSETPRMAAE